MKNWIYRMLLLFPLLGFGAEGATAKIGGLCFRFDDNQTVQKWNDMAEVFRKYDSRFCMSIISHWIHDPAFSAMLRQREQEGHEIMDHTAIHSVFMLLARTPEERKKFESCPVIDHWTGNKAHFRGIPDKTKFSKPIRGVFHGKLVTDLPAGLEKELKRTTCLYIPSTKKAYLYSLQGKELRLRSFWNEDNVDFPEREELEFRLLPKLGGFLASDELLRLQAEVSQENFKRAGVRPPVTWIQPGGYEPVLTADNLRKVFPALGYTGGATYPNSARKVYNEADPERCRFAMMWGDFSLEKKDISKLKNEIANRVARHQVLIGSSHMVTRSLAGGWTEYLESAVALLKWCKENDIPVLTQKEWAKRLYDSKTDPMFNLMPPLSVDRDGDGIPDGYSPAKGTFLKNGAFVAERDGVIFHLHNLTGMEIGANRLSYRFRRAPGSEIHVKVQPFARGWSPTYTKVFSRKIEKSGPQTCSFRFDIPAGTRFLNLEFRAAKLSAPLALDELSLTADR